MEVCNFLCFGSAIWSLCQKLFLLENMCTPNESGYIPANICLLQLPVELLAVTVAGIIGPGPIPATVMA